MTTVPIKQKQTGQVIKPEPKPVVQNGKADLDCLAVAVARHETGSCTLGVGTTHSNCFGIRLKSKFVRYKTDEASYVHFKDIWTRLYGGRIPTWYDAVRYSGNDKAQHWFYNVRKFYFECVNR